MWAFFHGLGRLAAWKSSKSPEIDEAVIGRTLTPELFRSELGDLGYDFEIFADPRGRIWRFRRIAPKNDVPDGDVW